MNIQKGGMLGARKTRNIGVWK